TGIDFQHVPPVVAWAICSTAALPSGSYKCAFSCSLHLTASGIVEAHLSLPLPRQSLAHLTRFTQIAQHAITDAALRYLSLLLLHAPQLLAPASVSHFQQ